MGNQSEVIGFDTNKVALDLARNATVKRNIPNAKFIKAEIGRLPQDIGQFDAIVGRRVLMYQPNAAESVECLLPYLKTNGLIVFQESDSMGSVKNSSLPLHTQAQFWIWNVVENEGGNIHMGSNLYSVFKQVGLEIAQVRAEAVLQTPETGSDLAWVVKMMLPRIIQTGTFSQEEIGIVSLEDRLRSERKNANTVFVRNMAFGIWGTIPV